MILYFLLCFLSAEVNSKKIEKDLVQPIPTLVKLNEIVEIKPITKHVVNKEAPNNCGTKGRLIEVTGNAIYCQSSYSGEDTYSIYICDEEKSFCKQQEVIVNTESPVGIKNWIKFYWNVFMKKPEWSSPSKIEVSPNSLARGFTQNKVADVFERAKKEKKPILLYYTQKYCPPCKLVKETSLAADDFQEFAKDKLLLQLDADIDTGDGFIKKNHLLYTPTFVFYNHLGEEIDRKIDFISPEGFRNWWNDIKSLPSVVGIESRPFQDLTHDEKLRLYRWLISSQRIAEAKELYLKYEDAFKRSDELISLYLQKEKMSREEKLKYTNKLFSLKGLKCSDQSVEEGGAALESVASSSDLTPQDLTSIETSYKKINNFLSQKVLEKPSDITCYVKQFYQGLALFNFIKNGEDKKKTENLSLALGQMLDLFPKLKGTAPKESIELYKGYILDRETHFKALEKLSNDHADDFSYDYLAANHEFYEKNQPNYAKALEYIDKTLKKSKGRIWEKSVKLKIQILIKLQKYDEASQLVNESLSKIVLPIDDKLLIHKFVQALRDFDRELKQIKAESKS